MNKRLFSLVVIAACVTGVSSCKKDTAAPAIIASDGTSQTLNGGAANSSGAAPSSVFLDLSTDKQTSILRNSWDLGFYCGADFEVIINNTTFAKGYVLSKNDLNAVVASDTTNLSFVQTRTATDYFTIDTITGDMSKTIIPTVSATDANNNVVILSRGDTGATTTRQLMKLRVVRNGSNGYTVQYARVTDATFKTITITKDENYNYKYVSLDNGIVDVEPQKKLWDFEWTYALYQTPSGASFIPYAFADMILINNVGGTTAAEVLNSRVTYANYADSSIANTTFSNNRHIIGSNWRSTQPATGVKTDRFYVLKDILGNVYKIKFNSMGLGDGGLRGYPQLEYKLVRKG